MSCNSCAKRFSLLRPEKGCPGCGFSFCSKCLSNKIFLPKLNSEAKVCAKCERSIKQPNNESQNIKPPDAYYKRMAGLEMKTTDSKIDTPSSHPATNVDDLIQARLNNLKEDKAPSLTSEEKIAQRLKGIKSQVPSTSTADIESRLAQLRGTPVIINKPVLPVRDLRTEQEQADDLMKQYLEQTEIDTKYKDEFDNLIGDIETRMQKLKGTSNPSGVSLVPEGSITGPTSADVESENEEESVRKIVEKLKAESSMEETEITGPPHDELPFCEICNEDATMRCLGCKYLFCKSCFLDHKDDDDGCNKYEPYQPPKANN